MASRRRSLVCVSIVMAMLFLADVTAGDAQQLSPDVVAVTQQAYLRGNTDVSGTKRGAVVTEEMRVGDPSFDTIFGSDYSNGNNPSANCRTRWDCPRH